MELKDKVALITGGGRGVGRATALQLAEAGVFDGALHQRLASALAAQGIRHAGMVDDDTGGARLGIGHLGGVAVNRDQVSPACGPVFAFYVQFAHLRAPAAGGEGAKVGQAPQKRNGMAGLHFCAAGLGQGA